MTDTELQSENVRLRALAEKLSELTLKMAERMAAMAEALSRCAERRDRRTVDRWLGTPRRGGAT